MSLLALESHRRHAAFLKGYSAERKVFIKAVIDDGIDLKRLSKEFRSEEIEPEIIPPIIAEPIPKALTRKVVPGSVNIKDIQTAVCRSFGVTMVDLLSERRTNNIVQPRHIAMGLCKLLTLLSLPAIGRKFGGRDHTTVLHAVRKLDLFLTVLTGLIPPDASLDNYATIAFDLFKSGGFPKAAK